MNTFSIKTEQDKINFLELCTYWHHAFIREIYVMSPSFLFESGQANPDALPNIGIIIFTNNKDMPGIEIKLYCAKDININFECDLSPQIELINGVGITFSHSSPLTHAERMVYRIMEKEETIGDRIKSSDYWYFELQDNRFSS